MCFCMCLRVLRCLLVRPDAYLHARKLGLSSRFILRFITFLHFILFNHFLFCSFMLISDSLIFISPFPRVLSYSSILFSLAFHSFLLFFKILSYSLSLLVLLHFLPPSFLRYLIYHTLSFILSSLLCLIPPRISDRIILSSGGILECQWVPVSALEYPWPISLYPEPQPNRVWLECGGFTIV